MQLVKMLSSAGTETVGMVRDGVVFDLQMRGGQYQSLSDILESDDPAATANFLLDSRSPRRSLDEVKLLAPLDRQEVWAAGVTYRRSRTERMKESAGAADFYNRVYEAPRPELFFKATPHRVVGPNRPVRVRQDSAWNVPEPEMALVLNSRLQLVGYTVGNDMSSRDIEGQNPLYLPQAKVYDDCCALGPAITLANFMPALDQVRIQMQITRDEQTVFAGETNFGQMARTCEDLIDYLARDNSFPCGVFLLTGTGIVPEENFTLRRGDCVEITIDGIGTLRNPVVQG